MSETVAVAKLRAYIERVERIESDIADLNADKSDVYKELRGDGFDVKTVRKIVAKRKLDTTVRDEQDALFELYWNALTTGAPRVHVHEAAEPVQKLHELPAHDSDGVVIEDQPETANEVPAQDSGGTAPGESPSGKSNAARPESVDSHLNAGRPAGQAGIEGVTAGETAPNSHSAPSSSRATDTAGEVAPLASPATLSSDGVPAFLTKKKTPADYRPNCQRPDACGASGLHHCYSCTKAMAVEVA